MDYRKQVTETYYPDELSNIEDSIESCGVTTFELLVLCRLPEDEAVVKLSEKLQIPPHQSQKLVRDLCHTFKDFERQASSPFDRRDKISTGLESVDSILSGGISTGAITEVFGSSGSGKSHFLLQTALRAQHNINSRGIPGKAVYVSTESALETRRLLEMTNFNSLVPSKALDDISYVYCKDGETQDHIISTQLPMALKLHQERNANIKLVIIDSVGHHFRLDDYCINGLAYLKSYLARLEGLLQKVDSYSQLKVKFESITLKFFRGNSSFKKRNFKRLNILEQYRQLFQLARVYLVAVLVANQVSDLFDDHNINDIATSEDLSPLSYSAQVGVFSGWVGSSVAPQGLKSWSRAGTKVPPQLAKRRRLQNTRNASQLRQVYPPKKILALGYIWAKLASNKILLWKSYELESREEVPTDEHIICQLELDQNEELRLEWIPKRYSRVISPVNLSTREMGNSNSFIIFDQGLKEET